LSAAEKYLHRKLHEETLFDDDDLYPSAKRAFSRARGDEIKLNRWLNTTQRVKLKAILGQYYYLYLRVTSSHYMNL